MISTARQKAWIPMALFTLAMTLTVACQPPKKKEPTPGTKNPPPKREASPVDKLLAEGQKALADGKPSEAVKILERARAKDLKRADISYELARAHAKAGEDPEAAIAYFRETMRLDPEGLGPKAQADCSLLRKNWIRIELEDADSKFRSGQYAGARKAYKTAFELSDSGDKATRQKAREGYLRAGAKEFAKSSLGGRKGLKVTAMTMAGAGQSAAMSELASFLESEVYKAFVEYGSQVLSASSRGKADIIAEGVMGQRIKLKAVDPGRDSTLTADVSLCSLLDCSEEFNNDLPPEKISVDLSIIAERDTGSGAKVIPVYEGSTLLSGDRFRLQVKLSQDAYLYAFIFDSSGQAIMIYPETEELFPDLKAAGIVTQARSTGSRSILIPPAPRPGADPFWFVLDQNTGTESFYVAASLVPLRNIEELTRKIGAAGAAGREASKRLASTLRDRSQRTRLAGDGQGQVEVIQGRGAAVRFLSFAHR